MTPALLVILLAMLFVSCGGNESNGDMRAGTPALQTPALQDMRAETPALQQPVDPALMDALQAELTRVLAAKPPRSISTPPSGERAAAPLGYNAGNSSLYWGYYSPGDYDQNGIVNVSDLTPLGQNFGKTAFGGSFPVNSTEAVVDGDGNGEINLADVTPIGVNFGVQCSGYNIYVAESETAVPPTPDAPNGSGASLVDSVAFNAANLTGGRKSFTLQVVPTAQQQHFWVRSTDGQLDGAASNSVAVNLPPAQPPQAIVKPTGDTGTMAHIVWDASGSIDPDGEIVSYEWDFDGDGLFDYSTDGTKPRADFYYYESGEYSATVRVTDDTQRTDTATAVVNITQVQDWHETVIDKRLHGPQGINNTPGIDGPVRIVVVDGRPAMFYNRWVDDSTIYGKSPVYRIADDSNGEHWTGALVYVDTSGLDRLSAYNGAAGLVEGLPAIAYTLTLGEIGDYERFSYFARARNPEGTQWNLTTILYSDNRDDLVGPTLHSPIEMHIITGHPALYGQIDDLHDYIRANDLSGSSWELPTKSSVDFTFPVDDRYVYASVNGLPARIQQVNGEDLLFSRSHDEDAQIWTDPAVLVDEHEKAEEGPRLLDVLGMPAVIYKDESSADLKYRRALDLEGSAWGEPVMLDPRAGSRRMAAIIDGRPAVLYDDRITKSLKFITANDAEGSYWNFPAGLNLENASNLSVFVIKANSPCMPLNQMTDIGGRPCFTYMNSNTLDVNNSEMWLNFVSFY